MVDRGLGLTADRSIMESGLCRRWTVKLSPGYERLCWTRKWLGQGGILVVGPRNDRGLPALLAFARFGDAVFDACAYFQNGDLSSCTALLPVCLCAVLSVCASNLHHTYIRGISTWRGTKKIHTRNACCVGTAGVVASSALNPDPSPRTTMLLPALLSTSSRTCLIRRRESRPPGG